MTKLNDSENPRETYETGSARKGISRRGFIQLGAGAGAAAALAACAPAPAATPAPAKAAAPAAKAAAKPAAKKLADTVRYAHSRVPRTFDPAYSLSNTGFGSARQVFDALVSFDPKGEKIIPQLAAEWKRIDDTTMEFKLRDDVKFSNGEDFTSASVVWTLNRLLTSENPRLSSTKGRMGPIVGAEAVDSTTVRILSKSPDPITLNRLVSLFMLPEKYSAEVGDEGIAFEPVGTGSFKTISHVENEKVVYEAWEGSWRGTSTIKRLEWFRFSESSAMIAALRAGDIDVIFRVEPDQAEGLKDDFNIRAQPAGSATAGSIFQDNSDAMANKDVRLALNHAVNKDEFIKELLLGRGSSLKGQFLSAGISGHHDGLEDIPYDPDKAKALLKDAGYADLNLTLGGSGSTRPIIEGVAGYFEAAGINTKIEILEPAASTEAINQSTDIETLYYNRDYFHMRDFDIFIPVLALKDQPHFANEEFKKLAIESVTEIDEEKRLGLIKKMAEIMHSEASHVFLFNREILSPHTKKISNLATNFDTATYFWEVEMEA